MYIKKWILACGAVVLAIALWWLYPKQEDAVQIVSTKAATTTAQSTVIAAETSPAISIPVSNPTRRVAALATGASVEEYVDWQREVVGSLIALNDADSLLAAALILHALNGEDPIERRTIGALLNRAHSAAPSDRAIVSVCLRVCRSMEGCNPDRYQNVVRNIDARNALGPIEEISTKLEKGTAAVKAQALTFLADLRLNLYYGEVMSRVARSISSAPTTPRFAPPAGDIGRMQSELALRAVDAIEVPSYLAVGPACQERSGRNRFSCDAIGRDLGRGELIELQRLGMELEAASIDSRRKRPSDITEAETYLNWIGTMKANSPPSAAQWISLLAQNRTELAATRAWLEIKGVAPPRLPLWFERVK